MNVRMLEMLRQDIRALAMAGFTHKQICIDFPELSATTVWRYMHGIDQRKPK